MYFKDMLVSFLLLSLTCYVLHKKKKTKKEVKSKRAQKEVCNSSSRMGAVYTLIVREEEILMEQRKRDCGGSGFVVRKERDQDIELVVPPVFSFCTKVLCFITSCHQVLGIVYFFRFVDFMNLMLDKELDHLRKVESGVISCYQELNRA